MFNFQAAAIFLTVTSGMAALMASSFASVAQQTSEERVGAIAAIGFGIMFMVCGTIACGLG